MKHGIIPHNVRCELVRRKLADIEVELAGLKGHMGQLPEWDMKCKVLDKAIKHLRKWRESL